MVTVQRFRLRRAQPSRVKRSGLRTRKALKAQPGITDKLFDNVNSLDIVIIDLTPIS
jgi:hypothetical protein